MFRLFVLVLLGWCWHTVAHAADPSVGDNVFYKNDATPRRDGKEIELTGIPYPATVGKIDGEWFWLDSAWLRRTDVMLPDEALEYYSDKIRTEPSKATGHLLTRAIVYQTMGKTEEAMADYGAAIKREPTNAILYVARAIAWKTLDEPTKAMNDMDQAIKIAPTYDVPFVHRGVLFAEVGEYSKAIKDLKEAVRLNPDKSSAYDTLAWIQATCPDDECRNGNEAVLNATKACEIFGFDQSTGLDILAAAYAEASDFEQAIKWEEKGLALAPDSEKARFTLRLDLYKSRKPCRIKPLR